MAAKWVAYRLEYICGHVENVETKETPAQVKRQQKEAAASYCWSCKNKREALEKAQAELNEIGWR